MVSVFRFVTVLILCSSVVGQQMAVPMKLQGALFKKIFQMNKSLNSKELKMAVLYQNESHRDEVIEGFKQYGIFPEGVTLKELEKQIQQYNVVYITPGSPSIKSLADKNKLFTITGVPELVEEGEASVGIGVEGGKPKIIVSKKKLQAEGQELTPELLKIAKVLN